jgi:prevent-host-death family protein
VKKARISELRDRLSRYLDHVKAGGRVLILDRDRPVAELIPVSESGEIGDDADRRRLEAMHREGVLRVSNAEIPSELLRGKAPGEGARVLEALLEEREHGR